MPEQIPIAPVQVQVPEAEQIQISIPPVQIPVAEPEIVDVPQEERFNQDWESFEKALSDTNTPIDQDVILIETLPLNIL